MLINVYDKRKRIIVLSLELMAIVFTTLLIYLLLPNSSLILIVGALFCIVSIASYFFPQQSSYYLDLIFKYRWIGALAVFIVLVLLRVNFSSIGMYDFYIPTKIEEPNNILFGLARGIRSDEWAVQVPTYFSQYTNNYSLFSTQISLSPSNMVIDYYAPVRNLLILGKPFSWGYVLFGNEIGLSWYWCSTEILLFMSALEMMLILTRFNKRISILGTILIGLSPEMQWWMQPHITILFTYSMMLFSIGYYFLTSDTPYRKILFSVLAVIFVSGFCISLFPSIQYPCGLIVLALLICTLVRDRCKMTINRFEILRFSLTVFAIGTILLFFLLSCRNDLDALMNTAYPGKRICLGGNYSWDVVFSHIYNIMLPYRETNISNNSEISSFIHFGPFFILLYPKIRKKLKDNIGRDIIIGDLLIICLIIEIEFMCIGFPEWLAEITLFKYINRMKTVYGWTSTLFTIFCINLLFQNPKILKKSDIIIFPLIYICFYCLCLEPEFFAYCPKIIVVMLIIVFFAILIAICLGWKRLSTVAIISVMVVAGATVNPVCIGISSITNHPLYAFISECASSDSDATWLCLDSGFYISNYVISSGAKCITSTNFVPDEEKWSILDPDDEYSLQTNRYSNMQATITENKSNVDLILKDYITININPKDLKTLGVNYIISTTDYTDILQKYGIESYYVFQQDDYSVYLLSY